MLYDGLPSLISLFLWQNVCTNETFYDFFNIQKLPGILTRYCGFNEAKRLLNTSCGAGSISTNRISGGTLTDRGQFPFMVAVIRKTFEDFHCGGNLINAKHVVTGELKVSLLQFFQLNHSIHHSSCALHRRQAIWSETRTHGFECLRRATQYLENSL